MTMLRARRQHEYRDHHVIHHAVSAMDICLHAPEARKRPQGLQARQVARSWCRAAACSSRPSSTLCTLQRRGTEAWYPCRPPSADYAPGGRPTPPRCGRLLRPAISCAMTYDVTWAKELTAPTARSSPSGRRTPAAGRPAAPRSAAPRSPHPGPPQRGCPAPCHGSNGCQRCSVLFGATHSHCSCRW